MMYNFLKSFSFQLQVYFILLLTKLKQKAKYS